MANKQNPMLAKLEAQIEAKAEMRRMMQSEIDLIAAIIAANNELKVGPGRASFFMAEILHMRMKIAQEIILEDDPEMLYTKHQLATRLKQIFGKEWPRCKEMFPLLKDYWD